MNLATTDVYKEDGVSLALKKSKAVSETHNLSDRFGVRFHEMVHQFSVFTQMGSDKRDKCVHCSMTCGLFQFKIISFVLVGCIWFQSTTELVCVFG